MSRDSTDSRSGEWVSTCDMNWHFLRDVIGVVQQGRPMAIGGTGNTSIETL